MKLQRHFAGLAHLCPGRSSAPLHPTRWSRQCRMNIGHLRSAQRRRPSRDQERGTLLPSAADAQHALRVRRPSGGRAASGPSPQQVSASAMFWKADLETRSEADGPPSVLGRDPARASHSVSGPYQDVLEWARKTESGSQFLARVALKGVANEQMRSFATTFRKHLVAHGVADEHRQTGRGQVLGLEASCRAPGSASPGFVARRYRSAHASQLRWIYEMNS